MKQTAPCCSLSQECSLHFEEVPRSEGYQTRLRRPENRKFETQKNFATACYNQRTLSSTK